MAMYIADDILAQLDEQARLFEFPMLDNGYVSLAAARLHAFRDEERWALVIEVLGANFRTEGASNELYRFGNCFHEVAARGTHTRLQQRRTGRRQGRELGLAGDGAFLYPVASGPPFDEEHNWYLAQPEGTVLVRGSAVAYDMRLDALEAQGIPLTHDPDVTCVELLRSLVPQHRDRLLATEEELRARVPADLPLFLRLHEWHHPDLADDEVPSDSEAFRMLAEALARGDASRYRPTLPPNTHWSNWPQGGTL